MELINEVELSGKIISECKLSFRVHGKEFYEFWIENLSYQGRKYKIKCVTDSFIDLQCGTIKKVTGRICSHRTEDGLDNYIFVESIEDTNNKRINRFSVSGYVSSDVSYFDKLNKSRRISEFMIATPRKSKSYYLSMLAWNFNAELTKYIERGTQITASGIIQTRDFEKDGKNKHVVELSIRNLRIHESEDYNNEDETE